MKTLILTHGRLAEELVAAARVIAGDLPEIEALALDWQDGLEAATERVGAWLARQDPQRPVLILTDVFGSTPTNAAMRFMSPGRVEVVTGVNLPMVVRLGCARELAAELGAVAHWLRDKGQRSICVASDVLGERAGGLRQETKAESPCS